MLKQPLQKKTLKHPILALVFICLALFSLAACSSNGGTGSSPPPTATPSPTPSPTPVTFQVTSVDLVANPSSIAGTLCGSHASFSYTATFHLPANTAGGTIQFSYTLNNGRGQTNASVSVSPGQTTKTYTFTSSGTLPPDHTYPGVAEVLVSSPNAVNSPQVTLAGACMQPAAFQVTSINMAVSPQSLAGLKCGTYVTVTYTATFHVAANSLGGVVQFYYSLNNGRSNAGSASLTFGPGETTKTFTFTWAGNLPADHFYPEPGGVVTTSPNMVSSGTLGPTGFCS